MHTAQNTQGKLFLSPAEVAGELRVSPSTVLRLIHAGRLPAIAVSERIYRIPAASFEMFKAGTLRAHVDIQIRRVRGEPSPVGADESLPDAPAAAVTRRA